MREREPRLKEETSRKMPHGGSGKENGTEKDISGSGKENGTEKDISGSGKDIRPGGDKGKKEYFRNGESLKEPRGQRRPGIWRKTAGRASGSGLPSGNRDMRDGGSGLPGFENTAEVFKNSFPNDGEGTEERESAERQTAYEETHVNTADGSIPESTDGGRILKHGGDSAGHVPGFSSKTKVHGIHSTVSAKGGRYGAYSVVSAKGGEHGTYSASRGSGEDSRVHPETDRKAEEKRDVRIGREDSTGAGTERKKFRNREYGKNYCEDSGKCANDRKERPPGNTGERLEGGTAEKRPERAREKLPVKRRLHIENGHDGETGKVRRRLKFETEAVPENVKPSLPRHIAGFTAYAVTSAVPRAACGRADEDERDNAGAEAARRAGTDAERMTGYLRQRHQRRVREKPFREVRAAEKRAASAGAEAEYRKLPAERRESGKSPDKRLLWKRRIKREYAATYGEASRGIPKTGNVPGVRGRAGRGIIRREAARKGIAAISVILLLFLLSTGAILLPLGMAAGACSRFFSFPVTRRRTGT